jgi:protein associated with RNAse G/E
MVDLDLDVIRVRATGSVEVVDEDEFAEHQVRYGYPEDVVRRAREVADRLAATLNHTEPFAGAYRRCAGRSPSPRPSGTRRWRR